MFGSDQLTRVAALRAAWQSRGVRAEGSPDADRQLGVSAADVRAWGLARECFEAVLESQPECVMARFNLAICCHMLGDLSAARRHAFGAYERAAIAGEEDATACLALFDEIRLHQAVLPSWFAPRRRPDHEIELQPLQPQHGPILFELSRDTRLVRLAGLTGLDSPEAFRGWVAARISSACQPRSAGAVQLHSLAMVHREYGPVGCMDLEQLERGATFSFWVGACYQRCGYGSAAVAELHALAQSRLGIDELFTAVRRDNARSRRVLERCAWIRLSIGSRGPVPVDFYYRDLRDLKDFPVRHAMDLQASLRELLSKVRSNLSI